MINAVEKFIIEFHGWEFPINPEKICSRLGISVEKIDLPKNIKGYFEKKSKKIVINSNLGHNHSRFILAREIRQAVFNQIKRLPDKNFFASELLMPTKEFIKVWNDNYPVQMMECAYYFDVSFDIAAKKAKKLYEDGMIKPETYSLFTNIFGD